MKRQLGLVLLAAILLTACAAEQEDVTIDSLQSDKSGEQTAWDGNESIEDGAAQQTEGEAESTANEAQPSDAVEEQPILQDGVLAEHLQIPWSIEKHGHTFYITERPGSIVKVEAGEAVRQEVRLDKTLATASEAGLLGFVLAPDFAASQLAYAYYTYRESGTQANRIVTLRLADNAWQEEQVLLDSIPSGSVHHGGRLKLGPDGKLYATTGDAARPEIAQALDDLGGKILRMNLDGSVPDDNPFPGSYVYSYGHRNPQGLVWTSEGDLYASEHGQRANDEINRIEAAGNYGWPLIQGEQQQSEMRAPLFTSGGATTWAPSGMAYDEGTLYVAALRGNAVLAFSPETGEQRELVSGHGRIRDVLIVDGALYFVTNNTDGRGTADANGDKLYKLTLH